MGAEKSVISRSKREASPDTITLVRTLRPLEKTIALLALGLVLVPAGCRRCDGRSGEPTGHAVLRDPQPFPGSNERIGVRRPPPRDNGDPGLLPLMVEALEGRDGPIGYLGERARGDRRFGPLEKRIVAVEDEPFAGIDVAPARAALEKARAGHLIVSTLDPPVEPWPSERASTIHELLRDGVPPPGFDPIAIGRAHILYRVAEPLEVTEAQMASITAYLRARFTRGEVPDDLDFPPDARARTRDGKVRFIVAVRGLAEGCQTGRARGFVIGEAETVRAALDDAAEKLRRRWSRLRDRLGCPRAMNDLDRAAGQITLQVELVHRMAAITDREPDRLYWLVELGREGLYLRRRNQVWMLSPARTIHRALSDERAVAERVGRWNGLPEDAWRDPGFELGRFETVAWVEPSPRGDPLALYRGVPLVRVPDITRESLIEALWLGAHFLERNQEANGAYRYLYRPLRRPDDRWAETNNIVRHSLCPLVMVRAHQLRADPALVSSAQRGIDFTLSHLERVGDRCRINYRAPDDRRATAKMGTVAAMVISILELGRVQDISEYRDELQCLGAQILAMQEDSGLFTHYDVPRGHHLYGHHNTIYPGELMLALSRLYEWSGDERYRQAFDRAMEFQRNWFRQTRSQTEEDGIYNERRRVDLISFEPWGIMAVDDMHRQTGDQRYADFGFELVEFMDGLFHFDLGRAQYADYLGGYFKTQQELPAINSCGYTEGAAAAFAIALRSGQRIEERRQALLLGLRFVLQLQYHPDRSTFHLPDPETASGGFRYNLSFSRVRNDYMYHAMNALALAAATLRPEDYPSQIEFDGVPAILEPAFGGQGSP